MLGFVQYANLRMAGKYHEGVNVIPEYEELFRVGSADGSPGANYGDANNRVSALFSKRAYKKGDVITKVIGYSPTENITWSSVCIGNGKHIELNSILVYMNHSCSPSVYFDCDKMQIIAEKDIKEGDPLTFFYPSTEWEMASPFNCKCGSPGCLAHISGAKSISANLLKEKKLRLNGHVQAKFPTLQACT